MILISYRLTLWVAIVAGIAVNIGQEASASNKVERCTLDSSRLPARIKPSHYELLLKLVYLDYFAETFEGQVKIDISVGEQEKKCPPASSLFGRKKLPFGCDNKEIILNANQQLSIDDVEVRVESKDRKPGSSEIVKVSRICRDSKSELVSIQLEKELQQDSRGQIILNFKVTLGSSENFGFGLFKGILEGKQSFVTQFEPAHARGAFPCFDEPEFKSTFDVILQHRKDLTALANTLPISQQQVVGSDELVETRFERTPLMSTYLLAFSVGQFDHLETKTMDDSLSLRVFFPVNQKERARWALEAAERAYSTLHEYFGIDQPLKKIDLLPTSMAQGAMENWGLVTFRANLLLLEPNVASSDLTFSAEVIAHELAHHWFGNLVTMKWWNNLWLNEAFANWMGMKIVDSVQPGSNVEFRFLSNLMSGLDADAESDVSHPIQSPDVKMLKDIEALFDRITYDKGSAVLRMLEDYIGQEAFKLGIRDYIQKFQFKNTDEHDLWSALDARRGDNAPTPVASMMNTWIYQAGFPVLDVELTKGNKRIRLTQQRFKRRSFRNNGQLWMIPINVLVVGQDGTSQLMKIVLSERSQEFSLPGWFDPSKGHWIKLNAGGVGFFRVQYSSELMLLMEEPIRGKQMSIIDKVNLLDDMKALFLINRLKESTVEEFMSWFETEDEPGAIYGLTRLIETLRPLSLSDNHLMLVDYYEKMDRYKCDLRENVEGNLARTKVLIELIKGKYEPAIEEGLKLLSSGELINQDCEWPWVVRALEEEKISRQE